MEIFWKTIASYNSATWMWQVLIILAGLFFTVWLIRKPGEKSIKMMKGFMIFLSLWVAFLYYFIYCEERHYTNVLTLFWCIMAAAWGWDLMSGHSTLERSRKYDYLAWLLLAMPFIYPVFSLLRGLSFPAMTTPVMPCSVAVFMIGILLLYSSRINMFIALLLCHWAIIGFSKTYFFPSRKISCSPVLRFLLCICFSGSIT